MSQPDPTPLLREHALLAELIASRPEFTTIGTEEYEWLGAVGAALRRHLGPIDAASLSTAESGLSDYRRAGDAMHRILQLLYRVRAELEARLPVQAQGSFVPAASPMDGFIVLTRALSEAKRDLLIVDPYLDHTVLEGLLATVQEGITIRLLTDGAQQGLAAGLLAGVASWEKQYGEARPIELKITRPRALHDRLILIDGVVVWLLSQSMKDFARRAPASINRAAPEVAELKIAHYNHCWESPQESA